MPEKNRYPPIKGRNLLKNVYKEQLINALADNAQQLLVNLTVAGKQFAAIVFYFFVFFPAIIGNFSAGFLQN